MPETAKRTARVPILGEDGRISDDYIPAAIGEGVESAEAAATRAETAATAAEGSAAAASQSATQAASSASAAGASATKAQQSAATASGAATQAQSAQQAAEAAKTGAESARDSAQTAASQAQQSAASVADKFIASAQATTLEPGSQATASVADQVLTIGVPRGDKGDKGDTGDTGKQGIQGEKGDPGAAATIAVGSVTGLAAGASPTVINSGTANAAVFDFGIPKGDKGDKGDPGDVSAVQTAEGSDLSVSTDEGTVTIDDSALRARIAELENQAANVVTGTSTDLVSHGEDAFPQKPREVRVKGKTWVNRWPVINRSYNGITVSTDEIGLITLDGELATSTSGSYLSTGVNGISANKSITALCSRGLPDGVYLYVSFQDSDGGILPGELQLGFSSTTETQKSATVPANTVSIKAGVAVKPGAVLSGSLSFRVMLVDGTEAPDCFTPCASITSVQPENLVTSGKNLLTEDVVPLGFSGTPVNIAGSYPNYTLTGTVSVVTNLSLNVPDLPLGTYTLSGAPDGSQFVVQKEDGSAYSAGQSVKFTTDGKAFKYFLIQFLADSSFYHTPFNPQIELGSTATDYEPPAVTTTPLPEVELRGLPDGTCDELVIVADGTCEVERRTQLSGDDVTALPEPTTEPQSPVTLPVLPAPTFNQYHDSDVPSDTSTTYARDINIVIDNLAKQIAGTAATVAINEATR